MKTVRFSLLRLVLTGICSLGLSWGALITPSYAAGVTPHLQICYSCTGGGPLVGYAEYDYPGTYTYTEKMTQYLGGPPVDGTYAFDWQLTATVNSASSVSFGS